MSSLENNFNTVTEKKIRFRPDAHVLFSNDNKLEDLPDNIYHNDQESKKKGKFIK